MMAALQHSRFDIDYKALLKKYMTLVMDKESISFLGGGSSRDGKTTFMLSDVVLTASEYKELKAIESEIESEY